MLAANSPARAESLLHSPERAADGIGLHLNADKTEYMSSNHTLNDGPLKLVDQITYLGSRVSSTENDINARPAKPWTTIDWLSVIWKSNLTDKTKHSFFHVVLVSILWCGFAIWTLNVRRKRLTAITQECCEPYWTSPGGNTLQNSSCTATYHLSRKLSKLDEPDLRDTARESRIYFSGSPHMD